MNFKLLERGIPSAELLRRVKLQRAAVRWQSGRTAALVWLQATGPQGIALGLCVTSGSAAGESAATETAARPGAPARLALVAAECPIRVDARKIPENFLDGFRDRDCASMDCQACGYCERIAAQAVSISPGYRTEVLRKYAEMDDAMATGRLWGV